MRHVEKITLVERATKGAVVVGFLMQYATENYGQAGQQVLSECDDTKVDEYYIPVVKTSARIADLSAAVPHNRGGAEGRLAVVLL